MNSLPTKLSRKAIAKIFDAISLTAWEKLFEREDQNGLAKLRGNGDFPTHAYYSSEGVIHWLIRNGHYTPEQIESKINAPRSPITGTISAVRTHLMSH